MERNQTAYTGFDPNHYQIELSVRGGMHMISQTTSMDGTIDVGM